MKMWKKVLAMGLALMLGVCAVGCGGSDEGGSQGGGSSQGGSSMTKEEKAKAAMEGVYKLQEIKIDLKNFYVQSSDVLNGKVYVVANKNEETISVPYLIIADTDGNALSTTALELSYKPEDYGEVENGWSYTNTYNYAFDAEGNVYAIRNENVNDYTNYENNVEKYYIDCWNSEGKLNFEKEIPGLGNTSDAYRYVSMVLPSADGVALFSNGDDAEVMNISKDGEATFWTKIGLKDKMPENSYTDNVIRMGGSKIAFTYYDSEWTKMYLTVYDAKTKNFEAPVEVPGSIRYDGFYNVYPGATYDFIMNTGSGIAGWSIGQDKSTMLMDYINSDVSFDYINTAYQIDADHIFMAYEDMNDNYRTVLAIATRVPEDQIVEKEILVIGGINLKWQNDLRRRMVDFNKTNDKYRITIQDFAVTNGEGYDYEASNRAIDNALASGKIPDMFLFDGNLELEKYENKGLFVAVDEMIQNDPELSKVDFLENVFDAFRAQDGKLYRIIPEFSIETMIGRKDVVGDVQSISVEDAFKLCDQYDADLMNYATREGFLNYSMNFGGSKFVDLKEGICNFNSDEFKSVLQAASKLPDQETYDKMHENDYNDDSYWNEQQMTYRNKKTILNDVYISDISNMKYTVQGSMGAPVSYVGCPGTGVRGIINANNFYTISAKGEHADVCFDFLKYYLGKEYQGFQVNEWEDENGIMQKDEYIYRISLHKDILKQQIEKLKEKNGWTDPETGEWYNYDTFWTNGDSIEYDPFDQAMCDELYDFITSVNTRYFYNESVTNIINEEVGAFFKGQKGVDNVVNIIQSRVQVYVNENM